MSPGLQALTDGAQALEEVFGDTFKVLSGAAINKTFTGRIYETRVIDPDMPLGADPRMASMLCIVNPPGFSLQLGDLFRSDAGTRYKILKLDDNRETSPTRDYEVEQQT